MTMSDIDSGCVFEAWSLIGVGRRLVIDEGKSCKNILEIETSWVTGGTLETRVPEEGLSIIPTLEVGGYNSAKSQPPQSFLVPLSHGWEFGCPSKEP